MIELVRAVSEEEYRINDLHFYARDSNNVPRVIPYSSLFTIQTTTSFLGSLFFHDNPWGREERPWERGWPSAIIISESWGEFIDSVENDDTNGQGI